MKWGGRDRQRFYDKWKERETGGRGGGQREGAKRERESSFSERKHTDTINLPH